MSTEYPRSSVTSGLSQDPCLRTCLAPSSPGCLCTVRQSLLPGWFLYTGWTHTLPVVPEGRSVSSTLCTCGDTLSTEEGPLCRRHRTRYPRTAPSAESHEAFRLLGPMSSKRRCLTLEPSGGKRSVLLQDTVPGGSLPFPAPCASRGECCQPA